MKKFNALKYVISLLALILITPACDSFSKHNAQKSNDNLEEIKQNLESLPGVENEKNKLGEGGNGFVYEIKKEDMTKTKYFALVLKRKLLIKALKKSSYDFMILSKPFLSIPRFS